VTPLSPRALALLRLAFGVLAIGGVGLQLSIQISRGYSVANFFSYFTNLSNLFAAAVLIAGAGRLVPGGAMREPGDFVRGLSAVNMIVVGVVYAALLRHVNLGSLRPAINLVLHDVMPVAVLLDWLLAPPKQRIGAAFVPACLIVPMLYLAYALGRGSVVDWYPYPFLDPEHHANGYLGVAAYAIGVGVTFVIVAWVVRASGNWVRGKVAPVA
jgi:hypothetical protein